MLPSLLLSSLATASTLTLTGTCGGPVVVDVIGLTPGGKVAVLTAGSEGSTPLPAGPCAGVPSGLDGTLTLRKIFTADGSGELHLLPDLPAPGTCNLRVQMVDVSSCTLTNVAIVQSDHQNTACAHAQPGLHHGAQSLLDLCGVA